MSPSEPSKRSVIAYSIGYRDGERLIECGQCHMQSFNLNDIKKKYCGNCHRYHDDFIFEQLKKER